jgi:ribosomal protein S18 acetylase RimI-like enzyme
MLEHRVCVYYYPQCPWIVTTIDSIFRAARKLGYKCCTYDLLSERLDEKALFKVYVDGNAVPIGIGMTDVNDIINRLLRINTSFQEQKPSETAFSYTPKKQIAGNVDINPLSGDNMDNEIALCIDEDFLYGAIPQRFMKKAVEMKKRWLQHILSKFKTCGYIAYLKKEPIGFVEFVPGELANKLGIETLYPPKQTVVILCLSVKKTYWGLKIGSELIQRLIKDLPRTEYKFVEVTAYKSGVWHPLKFYLKNNFKIVKDLGSNVKMAYYP